jgi:hypothetical protein
MERRMQHKPSQKRTLDEVLRSLQDLIRNELLEEPAPPAPTHKDAPTQAAAATTSSHSERLAEKESVAQAAPGFEPLDIPQVIESLHDLVTNELAIGHEDRAGDFGMARTPHQPTAADMAEAGDRHETPPVAAAESGEVQLSLFSLGETATPQPLDIQLETETASTADIPAAPVPAALDEVTVEIETQVVSPAPSSPPRALGGETDAEPSGQHPTAAAANDAGPTAPSADDIPVLEDIALPPPTSSSMAAQAAASPDGGGVRLDPSQAHELAVRVVARLNVELRRAGERPLEPRLIHRLERLLREALAEAQDKVKTSS